uniref:Uncharacterized protein n=1 Tax=Oncorhynchus kisutch TaxID=8019 RepID=A0A8C7DT45_ONCKI
MAQMFTISDSESEPSEEVGETEKDQSSAGKGMTGGPIGHALTVPEMRLAGEGRLRMNSESQAQELQGRGPGVEGMPTDGASFRGRSQSAPPALWAAKRYGRQLRRMSDEFDTWLDKGRCYCKVFRCSPNQPPTLPGGPNSFPIPSMLGAG